MKKRNSILLLLILFFALAGCGNVNNASVRTTNQSSGVNDVLAAGIAAEEKTTDGTDQTVVSENGLIQHKSNAGKESRMDDIDIDLTKLSSTMVYSEVYNMMNAPEEYIGKVVKMDGLFNLYFDETTKNRYFACLIQDATACCAQGIEFVLTDEYSYPTDYPSEEEEICVVGVFDTYEENGYKYCTLRNARLL